MSELRITLCLGSDKEYLLTFYEGAKVTYSFYASREGLWYLDSLLRVTLLNGALIGTRSGDPEAGSLHNSRESGDSFITPQ